MNNKGITLIALVITIIVLLILAGIGIAFLNGDNGILNKAIQASKTHLEAEKNENDRLNSLNTQTDKYVENNVVSKPTVLLSSIVKVGDYIAYNDSAKWRIIENSAGTIRIISNETTITKTIGNSGSADTLSYATAVNGINSAVQLLLNADYAISIRSVNNSDISNLTSLNMISTGSTYWFANTYTYGNQYHVGAVDETGNVHQNSYNDLYSLVGWNATQYSTLNVTHDLRMIVTLNNNVTTNFGEGTKENPYKLLK